MKIIIRAVLAHTIAFLLILLGYYLLGVSAAHAAPAKTFHDLSYGAIFAVVSAGLAVSKIIETLLTKANLLKTDQEKRVEELHQWVFDRKEGASHQLDQLHTWHKPVETPGGSRFPWKDSGKHHEQMFAQLSRMEDEILAHGKLSLQILHRLDVDAELRERNIAP